MPGATPGRPIGCHEAKTHQQTGSKLLDGHARMHARARPPTPHTHLLRSVETSNRSRCTHTAPRCPCTEGKAAAGHAIRPKKTKRSAQPHIQAQGPPSGIMPPPACLQSAACSTCHSASGAARAHVRTLQRQALAPSKGSYLPGRAITRHGCRCLRSREPLSRRSPSRTCPGRPPCRRWPGRTCPAARRCWPWRA
jgi:hypothetical protein